jgi:hypothetical protein
MRAATDRAGYPGECKILLGNKGVWVILADESTSFDDERTNASISDLPLKKPYYLKGSST